MTSFYIDFLFDFYSELGPPKPQKSLKFRLFYNSFLFFTLFKIRSIFNPILVPTWLHFPSPNPLKSVQKPILKGIDFLIEFGIDFKTAQEGPKTAQDAPRRRSKRQDGPKRPPRRPQDGPKRPQKLGFFFVLFRSWPPRAPKGPPRPLQD